MKPYFKPSVCIDAVFEGKSYEEACKTVKEAGISAIEFWGWWDRDLEALRRAQKKYDLVISACCTRFISLVDPSLRNEYLEGLKETIATAKKINTNVIISQVGDLLPGISREKQKESLISGLRQAAPLLEGTGITLTIEPLNERVDHEGYYLIKSDEAFDIVKQVNSPNIKVLFDIYHQQISEGHLIQNITSDIDWIGHFHAAGNPGRNELQKGEINYPQIFSAIAETDYAGYVGLEYWPTRAPGGALQEVNSWFHWSD